MGRAIVVGAGIIGLSCAWELHRRGEQVTIVDRGEPGAGCSWGNAGWIVPTFCEPLPGPGMVRAACSSVVAADSPLYVRPSLRPEMWRWLWRSWKFCNERAYHAAVEALAALARPTMALYDQLIAAGVECEMARSGVLRVFLGKEHMEARIRELTRTLDGAQQIEVLDRDAVLAAHPVLSSEVAGGLLIKHERHLRPEALTAGLASHLRTLGVEVHTGLTVIGLQRSRRTVKAIITERGKIEADSILVTMGAWSGMFLKGVGVRIPMLAAKGYSITVSHPVLRLSRPLYLVEAKIACSPYADALRIAGTVELSSVDGVPMPRRLTAMRRAVTRWLGKWEQGADITSWMGMRPVAPDGLPVIGRVPGFDNLYIATGHAKLGMTLAPATAVAVADLIVGGTTRAVDLRPFDPGRFQ